MLSKAICAQSINLDTQCYLPLICGIIFDCPVKVLSDFSNVQLLFFSVATFRLCKYLIPHQHLYPKFNTY